MNAVGRLTALGCGVAALFAFIGAETVAAVIAAGALFFWAWMTFT